MAETPHQLEPEVKVLADHAAMLSSDYTESSRRWVGSPFEWMIGRPSRQLGAIAEQLVHLWLASHGHDVQRSASTEADRVVDGTPVEIKFSTLWEDNESYRFQQIRDQSYELLFCLGVSPFDAHCWVVPKQVLRRPSGWAELEGLSPQHGGKSGSDTAWLTVDPRKPPIWLVGRGGPLVDALEALRAELAS